MLFRSPHEAEGLCATLVSLGFADYVVSEDTDVAVYGAPLLRQITTRRPGNGREDVENTLVGESKKRNKEGMNVLDPVRLRKELGMDHEMFVDLALLCGTDFTERIPGCVPRLLAPLTPLTRLRRVGYANALKLVRSVLLHPSRTPTHLPPDSTAPTARSRTFSLSKPSSSLPPPPNTSPRSSPPVSSSSTSLPSRLPSLSTRFRSPQTSQNC